jgi:alpha-glucoside transport system permease protein
MKNNPYLGWAFALPALILIVLFLIYPTFRTIQMSFTTGAGFQTDESVGFNNYVNLFTNDRYFFRVNEFPPSGAVFNTILWLVLFTGGTVGFGLLIAVMANSVRYEVLIKTIVFLPTAISFTAAGIIWRFVYSADPNIGVLNAVWSGIFGGEPIAWLGRTEIVNFAVIIAAIWLSTGFCTVILSAGLKSLPAEVHEAAKVDGANTLEVFAFITVPMLWPTILVVTTTMIINVLKAFDLVFIMTNGGPRNASQIIGFSMYNEMFTSNRPGYGSAIAVIMLILVLPFVYFNIRRYRSEEAGR